MKKIGILIMLLFLVTAGAACQNKDKDSDTSGTALNSDNTSNTDKELSGTISMTGSTSMEKFVTALQEEFMNDYPAISITSEFVGSSAGVEAAMNGTVDIGNSSRNLTEEEISSGVVENIVAIDGIAVVTDTSNTIENLSKDDLVKIFTGEITNWNQLSGADMPIVVVGREAGSGTRGAFEELLGIVDQCIYANEYDNTGAVVARAASTPGVIGYVSLDVIDDTVKVLQVEGVAASEETIKAGSYILSRPFVMATKGAISEQNELVQELFEYLQSEKGQQIIQGVGLILPDENSGQAADTGSTDQTDADTEKELSGTISMTGSTSMEKFVTALQEEFMNEYTSITITSEFVGSSAGVEAALNGTVDIGNSSRNLTAEEIEAGVVENIVAIDGIAVVTDTSNAVGNLTKDDLVKIFTGEITNWNQLSGADMPIVVVGREAGSGTRSAFEELLGIVDQCVYANEYDNTGAVVARAASTPGVIGYVSLDVVDDTVKVMQVEGVAASEETIKAGSYMLSRPFVMATKGAITEQNELVQELFDYIFSEKGQEITQAVGLILPD